LAYSTPEPASVNTRLECSETRNDIAVRLLFGYSGEGISAKVPEWLMGI
jgi:hypothetical protein